MIALHELPDLNRHRLWEDGVQVEALDGVPAWVARYDPWANGDDPPRKLSPYYDLERIRELIRGAEPFTPSATTALSADPDR